MSFACRFLCVPARERDKPTRKRQTNQKETNQPDKDNPSRIFRVPVPARASAHAGMFGVGWVEVWFKVGLSFGVSGVEVWC